MDPIDKAIEEIESLEPRETFSYATVAKKYGVVRTTLMRRHKGITASRTSRISNTQKLNPQQEDELVKYLEDLHVCQLQPTLEMVRNFASSIAKQDVGKHWVTRFINRHKHNIESHWTTAMDQDRHKADSEDKYRLFFELLLQKIEEYNIEPRHTYNMDEKGFLVEGIGTSKRVFSKAMWERKDGRASIQDGSQEWITLLACICGDGSALPPGILFASANSTIQSSWVDGIRVGEHDVFVSSSPNGWSNNDIGLAWLEQLFDRYTKEKAQKDRRAWRLLILDGHRSHITTEFIEYCDNNRILLMVFPPRSTQTLQPLDVVMFKHLSTAYSNVLTKHHNAQGPAPIVKEDFFPLFWEAWTSSFREDLILTAFEATGIWPTNAEVILKRFKKPTPETPESRESSTSVYSGEDRLKIKTLIDQAVKDRTSREARKIQRSLHHISTQNDLLHTEVKGLRQALLLTQKQKKKNKALELQQRKEYYGGAVMRSPRKTREAQARERVKQQEEEEQQLERARLKAKKAQQKVLKLQQQEERQRLRVEKREERERIKAEKKAQRELKIQERNAQKTIQLSQNGKRKASKPLPNRQTKQRRVDHVVVAEDAEAHDQAPQLRTRSGRNINLPQKFR